ncbi:MAG TPA: hypothetical protein VF780_01585 [Nitrosospira sp.]|jgi:hypothetical protein
MGRIKLFCQLFAVAAQSRYDPAQNKSGKKNQEGGKHVNPLSGFTRSLVRD